MEKEDGKKNFGQKEIGRSMFLIIFQVLKKRIRPAVSAGHPIMTM
jgi:hypothetical protein